MLFTWGVTWLQSDVGGAGGSRKLNCAGSEWLASELGLAAQAASPCAWASLQHVAGSREEHPKNKHSNRQEWGAARPGKDVAWKWHRDTSTIHCERKHLQAHPGSRAPALDRGGVRSTLQKSLWDRGYFCEYLWKTQLTTMRG